MKLTALGRLGLEGGRLQRQKPLLLLAYLAVEGVKPRRHLAELFFGETSDPLNSLSRALSNLRKESVGLVEADSTRAWTAVGSDVVQFLGHADAGDLGECEALYQGAFAEDVNLELGAELEEWVLGTREYLAGRQREVLLRLGEARLKEKNLQEAARYGEKAYSLTGASELEPEHLVRVYHLLTAGHSPKAGEVREEAESFGIDLPVISTSQTDEDDSPEHNLPLPKSSFVGREPELLEIAEQLAHPECRLLTLHGTGGVGKSRLALQAAYEASETGQFKDGITFIPLDSLTSADLIPSSLAESLKLTLSGQDDTLTQVIRALNDKYSLIILDNFEHLMDGVTQIDRLLNACPNLKLMVTSRERLRLEQEWVLTLTGLTLPEDETEGLEQLQNYDALNLFTQRAKRTRLDFSLTNEDLPYALKICQLVDGYPLGIELSAVWVKLLPLQDIAQEIEKNVDILTHGTRNALERHQSIRAVFEHSWKLLTKQEQDVLMKLSVFVGGFRREAAAEVADATLPILASLVDKSLLRVMANGRYDRHPLLYQFQRGKLELNSLIQTQIEYRHSIFFADFLKQKPSFAKVDEEITNVFSFIDRAKRDNAYNLVIDVAHSLALINQVSYCESKGFTPELLALIESAFTYCLQTKHLSLAGKFAEQLAYAYDQHFNFVEALKNYQKAYAIAREIDDGHLETVCLVRLATLRFERDNEEVDYLYEQAEHIARTQEDKIALVQVLSHRGYYKMNKSEKSYMEAWHLCNEASILAKDLDMQAVYLTALLNRGGCELELGDPARALTTHREVLKYSEEWGHPIVVANVMWSIGEDLDKLGCCFQAQASFDECLRLARQHGAIGLEKALIKFMQDLNYKVEYHIQNVSIKEDKV